jgi:branched-chain amino acid transport system permease protein
MAIEAPVQRPSRLEQLLARPRPGVLSVLGLLFAAVVAAWLLVNLAKEPANFFEVALIGVTNGAVFGLVALGYTLVYGILQLINFAHGDLFALSGLVASTMVLSVFSLTPQDGVLVILGGLLVTFLVAMAFGATVNASIERVAYRRLRNAPRLAPLITAVGMSFILQNVGLAIYGVNAKDVPNLIPAANVFSVGGVDYQWNKLFVLLVTIPTLLALTWLVANTRQGKAMRATAQDREAAAMMGIDINRTIAFTFLLAGALAGVGAVLFLLQFNMRYDTGFELGLIAFTSAVLGGIGNLTGAVLGAMLIGMIQAFNEGLEWMTPGGDWTRSIVFGILIAILVFRPEGLLGERTPEGG